MSCTESNFDYIIKKNDTKPFIKYKIQDCDDTDLTEDNLVVTASMWASSTLKNKIKINDTTLELKNNYNLEAVSSGDYLLVKKFNFSENMLVASLDNTLIAVERAQLGSDAIDFDRGNQIKIIKFYEVEAEKELEYNTQLNINGEQTSELSSQSLVYTWSEGDTSSPGIFFLEFKVSKVVGSETLWTKKYPSNKEGISIKITNDSIEV